MKNCKRNHFEEELFLMLSLVKTAAYYFFFSFTYFVGKAYWSLAVKGKGSAAC